MRIASLTPVFCLIAAPILAQNPSLFIGNNTTYFSDWTKRPFNFFNPEIIVSRKLQSNCILVSVNGFYGKIPKDQPTESGDVYDRLIFELKGNFALTTKNLLLGIGPGMRYRNEKRIIDSLFDFVGKFNKEYFDIGLNSSLLYLFKTGKNSILLKLSYSVFNRGRNPLSLGIFYGWQ